MNGFAQLSAVLRVDAAGIDPDVRQAPSLCLCTKMLDPLVPSTIGVRIWLFPPTKRSLFIFLSAMGQNSVARYITAGILRV